MSLVSVETETETKETACETETETKSDTMVETSRPPPTETLLLNVSSIPDFQTSVTKLVTPDMVDHTLSRLQESRKCLMDNKDDSNRRGYCAKLAAEAIGAFQHCITQTSSTELDFSKDQTISEDQFVCLMVMYQTRFEKEHKDSKSWGLDSMHLRMLFTLLTKRVATKSEPRLAMMDVVYLFIWLGPSTLPVGESIPPAHIAVRHIFGEYFFYTHHYSIEMFSAWEPKANCCFHGPLSRQAAKDLLLGSPPTAVVIARLGEGGPEQNSASSGGPYTFRHRHLVVSSVSNDTTTTSSTTDCAHEIQYKWDSVQSPHRLVDATPAPRQKYRRRGKTQTPVQVHHMNRRKLGIENRDIINAVILQQKYS